MYKLYVIPGSHACRSAILMLEHKGVPFRCRELLTLTHPGAVRARGFDAGGETRGAGSRGTGPLPLGELPGAAPALRAGDERVSTNRAIARFLDAHHPEPPLFPAD